MSRIKFILYRSPLIVYRYYSPSEVSIFTALWWGSHVPWYCHTHSNTTDRQRSWRLCLYQPCWIHIDRYRRANSVCVISSQYNNEHVTVTITVRLFVCTQVASREGYLTKIGKLRKVRPSYLLELGDSEMPSLNYINQFKHKIHCNHIS